MLVEVIYDLVAFPALVALFVIALVQWQAGLARSHQSSRKVDADNREDRTTATLCSSTEEEKRDVEGSFPSKAKQQLVGEGNRNEVELQQERRGASDKLDVSALEGRPQASAEASDPVNMIEVSALETSQTEVSVIDERFSDNQDYQLEKVQDHQLQEESEFFRHSLPPSMAFPTAPESPVGPGGMYGAASPPGQMVPACSPPSGSYGYGCGYAYGYASPGVYGPGVYWAGTHAHPGMMIAGGSSPAPGVLMPMYASPEFYGYHGDAYAQQHKSFGGPSTIDRAAAASTQAPCSSPESAGTIFTADGTTAAAMGPYEQHSYEQICHRLQRQYAGAQRGESQGQEDAAHQKETKALKQSKKKKQPKFVRQLDYADSPVLESKEDYASSDSEDSSVDEDEDGIHSFTVPVSLLRANTNPLAEGGAHGDEAETSAARTEGRGADAASLVGPAETAASARGKAAGTSPSTGVPATTATARHHRREEATQKTAPASNDMATQKVSTLMVRHLPCKLTFQELEDALAENGFPQNSYDFLYLPQDLINNTNRGYAFINLVDPDADLVKFRTVFCRYQFHKKSSKLAHVVNAHLQGFHALCDHFARTVVKKHKNCIYIKKGRAGSEGGTAGTSGSD
eukprot:g2778.t1